MLSLSNLQSGSRLGKETRNSNMSRICRNSKRSQEAAVMYIYTNGTSSPPVYSTTGTPKTTPMMMRQHPRYHQGSSWRNSFSYYVTAASSADNVGYSCFWLAHSHQASTWQLLRDATQNLIITQNHINLANHPSRNSYSPGLQKSRRKGKSPTLFFSVRETKSNTYCPGNRSL